MSLLVDGGIQIDLPSGWDGQIRGAGQSASSARPLAPAGSDLAAPDDPAEGLVLHAGSFPLPAERGDYGSGAVEIMTGADVLVCLLEHEREAASTALFAREGVPQLDPAMFSPETMQRAIAGMAGTQHFFQVSGRAFCLYVVVGSWLARGPLVAVADQVVGSITVSP
jgi:hypothetical protein